MRKRRFERTIDSIGLHLTTRDLEILGHIARHRFLDSRQIIALVGGSSQHLLRRLQRLFHAGYVDRPRAQVRYFADDGSRPLVYAVTSKGARSLPPGLRGARLDNRNVKQLYLEHTLRVADVVIAFTLASRVAGQPRLFYEEELPDAPFRWTANVRHGETTKRVGVAPDRTLALEMPNTNERIWYFIEADRGTMPITRRSLAQSSVWRKLLAYEATWAQGLHRHRFGCQRFRVLVITSGAERARHLAEAAAKLSRARGLFLFCDASVLAQAKVDAGLFRLPWLNASGEKESLLPIPRVA